MELSMSLISHSQTLKTPLHIQNAKSCELLIQHGADVNAVNSSGISPLFSALVSLVRESVKLIDLV